MMILGGIIYPMTRERDAVHSDAINTSTFYYNRFNLSGLIAYYD